MIILLYCTLTVEVHGSLEGLDAFRFFINLPQIEQNVISRMTEKKSKPIYLSREGRVLYYLKKLQRGESHYVLLLSVCETDEFRYSFKTRRHASIKKYTMGQAGRRPTLDHI